jgi:hypothetical protein
MSGSFPDQWIGLFDARFGNLLPWIAAAVLIVYALRKEIVPAIDRWMAALGDTAERAWSSGCRKVSFQAASIPKYIHEIDLFSPRTFTEDLLLSLSIIPILFFAISLSLTLFESHLDELLQAIPKDHVPETRQLGERVIYAIIAIEIFFGSVFLDLINVTNLFRFVRDLGKRQKLFLIPLVLVSLFGLVFFETSFVETSHSLVAQEVTYGTISSSAQPKSLQLALDELDKLLRQVPTQSLPNFILLSRLMPLILMSAAFPIEVIKEILPVGQRLTSMVFLFLAFSVLFAFLSLTYAAVVIIRAVIFVVLLPIRLIERSN